MTRVAGPSSPRPLGRVLAKLGPTWGAAPTRRSIQSLCLLLFLTLLFYVCWPYGSPDYARTMQAKERLPAETFLLLDPLLSLSAALAGKTWVPAVAWAGVLLLLGLYFPRGFCGYLCPLGSLIDLWDWAVGRRFKSWQLVERGWWVHLKYYLLTGVLVAALCGVLLSGFVAAIPVITRGLQFIVGPLQIGLLKGWYLVPPLNAGHWLSIGLFLVVLGLGVLRPRFWCRHVCPTGAVFSLANRLRLRERKVSEVCTDCGRCIEICPFDAIAPAYQTRTADCTVCETCGGVCPSGAIQFVARWREAGASSNEGSRRRQAAPILRVWLERVRRLTSATTGDGRADTGRVDLSRRGFLAGVMAGLGSAVGVQKVLGAKLGTATPVLPVRPPGSVPEPEFLQLCIRCAACFQACPNNVLQPLGFEQGLEGLWTPQVVARWSGCEPSCNNCGQVCPTGAIRPLSLDEKRVARMGLAVLDERTCLPHAQREACQLCVDECKAAGYDALEFRAVGTRVDAQGAPIEDSGFLAPVVLPEKCVGCGLCETRCHKINVLHKRLLADAAIQVLAGPGREDRLLRGSYRDLREAERRRQSQPPAKQAPAGDGYMPDFLK